MSTPGVTLSGTLNSISGAVNAGSLSIVLVNYGVHQHPLIQGTALLAPIDLTVQAAADGTWSTTLWGNYQIVPTHTYYDITIFSDKGEFIQNAAYLLNTAGSFDLSTLTPMVVVPVPSVGFIPIVANPVGAQTIVGFPLNLPAGGTSVTLVATDSSTNIATTAFVQNVVAHVSAGVTSWNSRTGNVVPLTGDYSFAQISGSVAASQLPNPTATTLGGIESFVAQTHKWINAISTSGVPSATRPDYSDLTGTPQLALSLANASHKWFNSFDATTGLFTQTQPAFSDISGTAATGQIPDLSATYLTVTTATGTYLPLAGGTLTGNLLFSTDNTKDIGASGATRPRTVYVGTSVVAPVVNATTGFQVSGSAALGHFLRGDGSHYVDGQVQDSDIVMNAGTSGDMNASGGIHGFVPSPPNDPSLYLDSQGHWTIPSSSSSDSAIINVNQVAHGFSIGNWVYWSGTVWALAKADALATLAHGVVNHVSDVDNFTVTLSGYVGTLSGLTAGALYYLSSSSAGAISTAVGTYGQPVLLALFSGSGVVMPYNGAEIVNTQQVGGIFANGNTPSHEGQILISQPGNTAALWADPLVQGVYDPGTNTTTGGISGGPIKPVLIGGSDYAGTPLLHDWKVDSSGIGYINLTQVAGASLGATAVVNFGTAPAGVAVQGVNASIFKGTAAISASNALNTVPGDGTSAMGTMSNFGTSPGAVKSLNVNASLYIGTTIISATTAGIPDVNIKNVGNTAVVTGGVNGSQGVGGLAASGASKAGSPVQIGGVFNTTQPTVTTGQVVEAQSTSRGAQIVATGVDTFTVAFASGSKVIPWDGTTQATFKPASTASVVGDTSLIMQVSPNQPTSNMTGTTPNTAPVCTTIIGGIYNSSAPTPSSGQTLPLQTDNNGNLKVLVNGTVTVSGTATVSGTVAVTQSTAAVGTAGWPVVGGNTAESTAAWTSVTAGNTALAQTITGYGTTIISINQGSTITGGVITFEACDTGTGTNWYSIQGSPVGGGTAASSYTLVASTNAAFQFSTAGWVQVRARLSTVITGSATVNIGIAAMAFGGGGSSGGGAADTQYAQGTTNASPTGTVAMGLNPSNVINALSTDSSGYLQVNVKTGGGSAASVGTIGSAAPTSADQIGWNTGSLLQSVSANFPMPVMLVQNENDTSFPFVIAGIDPQGNARPLLTDEEGCLILSAANPPASAPLPSQLVITTPNQFLTGSQGTTIAASTSPANVTSATPGYFSNITGLIITNSSATSTLVTLSDGFKSYIYYLSGPGGIVMEKVSPKVATTPNTVWTVTCGTSVSSVYVDVEWVNVPLSAALNLNGSQGTTITSSVAATTIVPAQSGYYTNLTSLVVTNSSATATLVTLSDGLKSYIYSVQGPGGIVMSKATPKAASNPNTAWTITCGTSVASVYVDAEWVSVVL